MKKMELKNLVQINHFVMTDCNYVKRYCTNLKFHVNLLISFNQTIINVNLGKILLFEWSIELDRIRLYS